MVDIGKSTKIALAQRGRGTKWLSEQLGISREMAAYHCRTAKQSRPSIEKLANVFDLEVSEFIALAEGRFE